MTHIPPFLEMYQKLFANGRMVDVKGVRTLELMNQMMRFQPDEIISSFTARKLNLDYCKAEFDWYLGADRNDHSIELYATIWKKIRDPRHGGFNSQYGEYIFNTRTGDDMSQWDWCFEQLTVNPSTRQAVIMLLSPEHLRRDNPDVVCTSMMQFFIRDDQLHMTVTMRSNDAIYGTTNDVFCFGMLHRYMLTRLTGGYDNKLTLGPYTHFVNSLHVYEPHFDMLAELVRIGIDGYYPVAIPRYTLSDFHSLQDFRSPTQFDHLPFATWIRSYAN